MTNLPVSTDQWVKGTKLWWNARGYGHKNRIPVELLAWSASGKRAYLKVPVRNYFGQYSGWTTTHASPAKLELRNE